MSTLVRGAVTRASMLALAVRLLLLRRIPPLPNSAVRPIGACRATVADGTGVYTGIAGFTCRAGDPFTIAVWVSYADRVVPFVLDRDTFEEAYTFGHAPIDPATRAASTVSVTHRHPSMVLTVATSTITIAVPAQTVLALTRRWRRRVHPSAVNVLPPPMNIA